MAHALEDCDSQRHRITERRVGDRALEQLKRNSTRIPAQTNPLRDS